MWILVADVAALLAAPGLDALVRRSAGWSAFVGELCRAAVAGIVLLHLLPHAWQDLGVLAIVLFVAGAVGVLWVERQATQRDATVLGWAAAALGAHHLADGVGLALAATEPELGPAVILHAVPVALVAWRLGVARGGPRIGWALVVWIAISTVIGFAIGRFGVGLVIEPVAVGVACALGGGLLHALSHVPHATGHPRASGLGVVVGLGVVAALAVAEPTSGELGTLQTIGRLTLSSAPALLFGFGLAGVAAAFVPGSVDPERERFLPWSALPVSFSLLGLPVAGIRVGVAALLDALRRRSDPPAGPATVGARARLAHGWRVATVELPDRVLPWFGAGLVAAALIEPLLDPARIAPVPPALQVPILAVLGTPVVLGATGMTPVAAILLHKGVTAGATLAFLLAGPARASSWQSALGIALATTVLGLGIDAALPALVPVSLHGADDQGPLAWICAVVLVGLGVLSLVRQGAAQFVARVAAPFTAPAAHPH